MPFLIYIAVQIFLAINDAGDLLALNDEGDYLEY